MKDKADRYAVCLTSPKLKPRDVMVFHKAIYTPAMRYSLPAVAVDEECFAPVQSNVLAAILNGIGVASTLPISIRHGPLAMGGLDLLDLRTESGICSLCLLRDSIFSGSETGKLMLISLHASQLEAGCGFLLLENPAIAISYLTPTCWVLSICQFLYQHNYMTVTLTSASLPPLRYQHDKYIMDPDI